MNLTFRPMGPGALLVTGVDDPAGWALGLRALSVKGVIDVVPAAETVLVTGAVDALAEVRARIAEVRPVPAGVGGTLIEIAVRYDGADVEQVARQLGWSVDQLVDVHTSGEYTAAFCGFAPGFAYLTGLPDALHLPRRASPRTRVPAGSVAIAGGYAAVYPRSSPGGWHLLGTAEVALFDPASDHPALVSPGDRVKFVAT